MKGESHVNHEKKIYLVRAGRVGQDEDRALEDNIAIIGFIEIHRSRPQQTTRLSTESSPKPCQTQGRVQ